MNAFCSSKTSLQLAVQVQKQKTYLFVLYTALPRHKKALLCFYPAWQDKKGGEPKGSSRAVEVFLTLHDSWSAGYANRCLRRQQLNLTDPFGRKSLRQDWQPNLSPVNSNAVHCVVDGYQCRVTNRQRTAESFPTGWWELKSHQEILIGVLTPLTNTLLCYFNVLWY